MTSGDDVWRVWLDGHISRVAGNGSEGFSGDGGPATAAALGHVTGLAALPDGGFLIADAGNSRVRRVWPDGHISTVAGNGSSGFSGDGGPATAAELSTYVTGVAALPDGGFLIADGWNSLVRRVWPDGHISTVAGNGDEGFSGDGGPATAAAIGHISSLAVLRDGSFVIADTYGFRVRRVWPDGHISTVAGNGKEGGSGDGGPATAARLRDVRGLAALPDGGFLIAESRALFSVATHIQDRYVRRVWPDGHISTIAGNGRGYAQPAYFGDGGFARSALLPDFDGWEGESVAVLPDGSVLIGFSREVRLVVGSRGTGLLAAAIRPLAGTALTNGYRLRLVLTKPARVTVRLFRSERGAAVASVRSFKRAGESTFTVSARRALDSGQYAVDVQVASGSQHTRTVGWVYLGGRLPESFLHEVNGVVFAAALRARQPTAFPAEPLPTVARRQCRQITASRVDCEWDDTYSDSCAWISASFLTSQGQIYSRHYACPTRRSPGVFKLAPRWGPGRTWEDISGWISMPTGTKPTFTG